MRKYLLLSSVATAPLLAVAAPAQATVVATIDGCYDCVVYDTPTVTVHNTSGGDLTNVQLLLTPYQPGTDTATVAPQTINVGTIANGANFNINWNAGQPGTIQGNLFSYDYDDSYGNFNPATGLPGYTNPACVVGTSLCSPVGNFQITLTATISGGTFNGQPVFSIFSPTTNQTGGFIGFEGLDPNGVSETTFDQHSGSNSTVNGQLAQIVLGTPPPTTPLPAALPLFASGLGVMGLLGWRRKRKAQAVA